MKSLAAYVGTSVSAHAGSPSRRRSPCLTRCHSSLSTLLCIPNREDGNLPLLLERERQTRRDEVAIDMEDRSTKKGTPPVPSESGDIRDLRRTGATSNHGGDALNGMPQTSPTAPGRAPMVE